MSLAYTVRPLSDSTWLRPAGKRTASRFDSKWSQTLDLLERELIPLKATDLVLEVDVPERGIRNDGRLRADTRASSPAVVIAFESKIHGPMLYRCDRYYAQWSSQGDDWQQNARAIALTLEALRAVDRHGATETGQQYTGFKALPSGTAMPPSHMTTEQAYDALAAVLELADIANLDVDDAVLVRRAKAAAHPDRQAGDRALWDQVERAARVLGVGK